MVSAVRCRLRLLIDDATERIGEGEDMPADGTHGPLATQAIDGATGRIAAPAAWLDELVAGLKVPSRRQRRRRRKRRDLSDHWALQAKASLINAGRRAQPRLVRAEIDELWQRFFSSIDGIDKRSPAYTEAERRLCESALEMYERAVATAERAGVECDLSRRFIAVLARLLAVGNYRDAWTYAATFSYAFAMLTAAEQLVPPARPVRLTPRCSPCQLAKPPACRNRGREGRSRSHRRVGARTGKESASGEGGPGEPGPAGGHSWDSVVLPPSDVAGVAS